MNGTNFLGLVFQDPARWGLAFESLVGSLECRISERRTPRPWPKITKRNATGKHDIISNVIESNFGGGH